MKLNWPFNKKNIGNNFATNKQRFDNIIDKINNANPLGYDNEATIKKIVFLIVEYLNHNEYEQALEQESSLVDNSLIIQVYYRLERFINDDKKISVDKTYEEIDINSIPILLNPWSGDRVINNLLYFGTTTFDGIKYSSNILNTYIEPVNFAICNNGNHSQLAAKLQNNGKTVITQKYDMRPLYKSIRFDGNGFKLVDDSKYIDLGLDFDKEIIFYAGVLFELGRYLV